MPAVDQTVAYETFSVDEISDFTTITGLLEDGTVFQEDPHINHMAEPKIMATWLE